MTTDHIQTAYEWHGGQWSPLYSYASTGGKVHSEEHHYALIREIEHCLLHGEATAPDGSPRALRELLSVIISQPTEWGIFT